MKTIIENERILNWNNIVNNNEEIEVAIEVIERILSNGYECYFVGGFVRNLLLNLPLNDIDIVSSATPDQLECLFDKVIDAGKNKAMGVTIINFKGYTFEISTYRKDIYDKMSGKGADSVEVSNSLEEDLKRRDITINAICLKKDGTLIDFNGGIKDLNDKVIISIGNPVDRFKEDFLRMVRCIRFASILNFEISKETKDAIKSLASNTNNVAQERINKEIFKCSQYDGKTFAKFIELLDECNLLQYIFKEIKELQYKEHGGNHFHPEGPTVYLHIIETIKCNTEKNSLINLSCLFHDIGKLITQTIDEEGKLHYYGHDKDGVELFEKIANRMKLDNNTKDCIKFSIRNHMLFHKLLEVKNSTIYELLDNKYFDILTKVAYCDDKCRLYLFDEERWNRILERIEIMKEKYIVTKKISKMKKEIVNGYKIAELRKLDLTKDGIKIGKIIKQTVDWVINENFDLSESKKEIIDYIMNIEI